MQSTTRPNRILVVDDDARIRDLLRRYLAQEGFEVLLAEANPLRPTMTRLMGLEGELGIRDSFAGADWHEVARRIPGLDVFVAGSGIPTPDAIDPFDARLMDRFRQRLGDAFDWLILDGPSLDESADAETLSHLTDLTVVVVKPGTLTGQDLGRCLSRLNRSKIAGIVFNRIR